MRSIQTLTPRTLFHVVFIGCALLALALFPRRVFAQTHCPNCPDPCAGFVSEPCSRPSGCAGKTVCVKGTTVCDTSGSTVACGACGEGGYARCDFTGALSPCRPVTPLPAEQCNGCDDDANGQTDENIAPVACTLAGGCTAFRTCAQGAFGGCTLTENSTAPCAQCGDGGIRACRLDGGFGACRPLVATAEGCNNCDDDADGIVDNAPGSTVAGTLVAVCEGAGACKGSTTQCTPAGWSACKAPSETCNGLDENCDGQIDEAGVCRQLLCTP